MENVDPMEGLRYIAESPSREHGGFHPEAIKTAQAAIKEIERLRGALKIISLTSYESYASIVAREALAPPSPSEKTP